VGDQHGDVVGAASASISPSTIGRGQLARRVAGERARGGERGTATSGQPVSPCTESDRR
jgi:hypothetical protein